MNRIVALAGGTGSAKFIRGLKGAAVARFTVVANTGDNAWFHGLYVCPDVDTVTYALAGILDKERGWGIRGDEFKTLEELKRLGSEGTWFNIGDKDMATHLFRTASMAQGKTLTEISATIARRLGVWGCTILPATDSHVETHVVTAEKGEMHLQEFWVREKGRLTPTRARFVGASKARPTPEVLRSLKAADRIVFSPANPITSILPILEIGGFRAALKRSRARKVAISPMLGDRAYSGPAAGLLKSRGLEPSSLGVARLYKGLVDVLVVDESDRARVKAIERTGVSCLLSSTLMKNHDDEIALAKVALEA